MTHRLFVLLCALPLLCAAEVTFTGSPDPFPPDANGIGQITLTWSAPGVSTAEIHLFSPSGQLFTRGTGSGSATTGDWVTNGMTFYLQDVSASTPGTTLATFTARSSSLAGLPSGTNLLASMNNGQQLFYSAADPTMLEVHLFNPSGPLLARMGPGQGMVNTGLWVFNGMRFYLQDVSNGNPLTYQHTVATAIASVNTGQPGTNGVIFGPTPGIVPDYGNTGLGSAGLYWNAPGTSVLQVRVGAPNGPLFAETGSYGFGEMMGWVTAGMVLYLQNASSGDPTSAANTLAISTVDLQPATQHYVSFATANYGVQFYSRDSGYLLGLLYLPPSVSVMDLKTSPDGTLLYVAGSDGKIYGIDPFTLTITSTIDLVTNYPTGTQFVWIKNQQGKDLILTFPDASGNLLVVDPRVGTVTNTIACNCASAIPTYDPFNQTTYLNSGRADFLATQLVLQTLTSALSIGPSISLSIPITSTYSSVGVQIVPLRGGALGQLLLTWFASPIGPGPAPTATSSIYDLATATTRESGLDAPGENSFQAPISSPDGESVYSQALEPKIVSVSHGIWDLVRGPISLYQLGQAVGGPPVVPPMATTNLPEGDVLSGQIAYDSQFVYLPWQEGFFFAGFHPQGPIYIYKADSRTLQPVGSTTFINTQSVNASPFPFAAGSYLFTGCANAQTGSLCSP